MPALAMRGRYLMREYFADSDIFRKLTEREREIMVGLWMLADDEGWLPRDIPAISAAIYRYVDPSTREGWVKEALERLAKVGKAEKHRCCVRMTSVSNYPRAGTKSYEHRDEHKRHKPSQRESSQTGTESSPSPVPTLPNPSVPVVAGARAPGGRGGPVTKFRELVPPPAGYGKPA